MGREIKMSVVKNSQKETNKPNDSNKKSKPSNNKFKPSFKKQKGLYLRKGKFIG
jgi:hypothetical protein